jgi:DNA-binding beta-propeller fold protein YncE
MKLLRATQFAFLLGLLGLSIWPGSGSAQSIPATPFAATSAAVAPERSAPNVLVRAFPYLNLGSGFSLTYVGVFSPDAVFRTHSRVDNTTGHYSDDAILPAGTVRRQADVPTSMLVSNERVVEDFEPPLHAEAVGQVHTPVGSLRNRFLTYAYGRPSVLHAPLHVATDSQNRVIISDPDGGGVHVIDPKGKTSFRIVSGPDRRLRAPHGVAVDAEDNLYVADPVRGMVVVFDRNGNFVRYIGSYRGEPEYARPTGIAIDRQTQRLYLIDTPRNLIFVLDLNGKVLKSIGKHRNGTGTGEFDDPTDIAVNHKHVFVLDRRGTRMQVLDADGNPAGSFDLPHGLDPLVNREDGLGTDQEGNVYVSSFNGSLIRVYSYDGRFLSCFGQPGRGAGEFAFPGGLWIDSSDRLYVADSGNGRVQLFQIKLAK